jgi:hypothetical protein
MKVSSPLVTLPHCASPFPPWIDYLSPAASAPSLPPRTNDATPTDPLPPAASRKVVEREELEDRMAALNFQREGPRRQREPPETHRNGADIFTVRYDDEGEDEGERQGRGGTASVGEVWKKLKRVGKRATVLEALRRR